eukprot:6176088-Karenia_brevis.AAC.1
MVHAQMNARRIEMIKKAKKVATLVDLEPKWLWSKPCWSAKTLKDAHETGVLKHDKTWSHT